MTLPNLIAVREGRTPVMFFTFIIDGGSSPGSADSAESSEHFFFYLVPIFGASLGPLFPAAMQYAEVIYTDISGQLASLLVCGASLGELSIPQISTVLFSVFGPDSFTVSILGFSVVATALAKLMLSYAHVEGDDDARDEREFT